MYGKMVDFNKSYCLESIDQVRHSIFYSVLNLMEQHIPIYNFSISINHDDYLAISLCPRVIAMSTHVLLFVHDSLTTICTQNIV